MTSRSGVRQRSAPIITSIRNLPIDTPSGQKILLSDVASVQLKPTPNVIQRDAHSRRIDIEANVKEGQLGTVVAAMEEGLKKVELPPGFHTEILGEYQERQAATNTLLTLAIGALAVIYLLLQVAFGELAAGHTGHPHPADRPRGRRVRRLPGRRGAVTGLDRGLPDSHGHRGKERHPAHQPLPAPGEV